jgi:hypothetical protein
MFKKSKKTVDTPPGLWDSRLTHGKSKNKMRTKTLLVTAALVAAGVASSMAQSNVYSLNVVGYINLPLTKGFNLLSAPLSGTNNLVGTVLGNTTPVLDGNALLYTWDSVGGHYAQALSGGGDGTWLDANGNPATNTIIPGESFFIFTDQTGVTLTLVGSVSQGPLPIPVNAGFGFYGDPVPVSSDIVSNGFPTLDNSSLYTWNPVAQTYNQALAGSTTPQGFLDQNGNPVSFAPTVGQGFIYMNPGAATSWPRSFTVQ